MKLINKNSYNIMFGMDFLKAGEVKDIDDKTAKLLLNQPNVEEYIAVEDAKKLEEEVKALKAELKKTTTKKAKK